MYNFTITLSLICCENGNGNPSEAVVVPVLISLWSVMTWNYFISLVLSTALVPFPTSRTKSIFLSIPLPRVKMRYFRELNFFSVVTGPKWLKTTWMSRCSSLLCCLLRCLLMQHIGLMVLQSGTRLFVITFVYGPQRLKTISSSSYLQLAFEELKHFDEACLIWELDNGLCMFIHYLLPLVRNDWKLPELLELFLLVCTVSKIEDVDPVLPNIGFQL